MRIGDKSRRDRRHRARPTKSLTGVRPYTDAMRKDGGWTLDYDSRSGGVRCRVYVKQVTPARTLELQLWADGLQRVTFMENGRMATSPTCFTTPGEMLLAIKYESVRPQVVTAT